MERKRTCRIGLGLLLAHDKWNRGRRRLLSEMRNLVKIPPRRKQQGNKRLWCGYSSSGSGMRAWRQQAGAGDTTGGRMRSRTLKTNGWRAGCTWFRGLRPSSSDAASGGDGCDLQRGKGGETDRAGENKKKRARDFGPPLKSFLIDRTETVRIGSIDSTKIQLDWLRFEPHSLFFFFLNPLLFILNFLSISTL